MIEKQLAKIAAISVGFGGYDDAMFGVNILFRSGCWGVSDFRGAWAADPSKSAKWTKADQIKIWGETMEWLKDLTRQANVMDVADLKDVPVEVTMKDGRLESWRVLTEVIQ